jgi:TRAP-type mannitol/chloroaromatic compound transport system substrate-binding protein
VPEFNPDLPFAKIRHISGKVRHSQGGHIFTRNGVYEGPDPNYQPPAANPVPEQASGMLSEAQETQDSSREEILKRAQAKLSAVPQEIVDAQKENAAALQAEEHAE